MAAIPGKGGFVKLNGDESPFTDWSLSVRQERIDCTDIRRVWARHRLGTPVGEITVSGFYPGSLGLTPGQSVEVTLDCGDGVPFGPIRCLFEGPTISTSVKGAAKMDFRFLIDDDLGDAKPLEF